MEVVRALNNSAVLATSGSGERCVLMGKGIGWNKGLGDAVDMAAVTQRFVPDGSHSLPQLAAFLADIDLDIVLVAKSAQMTRRISEILDVVAARTGADIHADPMNVARFVAHLRYLLARMDEDRLIEDGSSRGLVDLRESHPEAHAAAEDLRSVFSAHGRAITADEVGYLSLHIARLTSAQRRS